MNKISTILSVTVILLLLFSCSKNHRDNNVVQERFVLLADTALKLNNGVLFYKNHQLFSGAIKDFWKNGQLKSIQLFINGKQQGLSETFYEDGKKESARWYKSGEKDSVHTGWWPNGNKKYQYYFNNGLYNGLFTEWYQSGRMIRKVMYAQGSELSGQGWRETGKLYMNFIMRNGRRYGMNNSNLCYGLKKEGLTE